MVSGRNQRLLPEFDRAGFAGAHHAADRVNRIGRGDVG
jgi:hypothetical protein